MTELVKGLEERMCRNCYELIAPKGDAWEDSWDSLMCRGGLHAGNAHKLHDETPENRYRSHCHDGEVSAVLERLYTYGEHSKDFGDADTFGHFVLFRDCRSILHIDSQGFAHHATLDTVEECDRVWQSLYTAWLVYITDEELT